jgi:hypothetical protein
VDGLMPQLIDLVTDGVIEVQATEIAHIAHPGELRPSEGKNG